MPCFFSFIHTWEIWSLCVSNVTLTVNSDSCFYLYFFIPIYVHNAFVFPAVSGTIINNKIMVKMDQDKGICTIYYMIVHISAKYTNQLDPPWWNKDCNFLQMCICLVLLYNIWYRGMSSQCLFCVSLCLLASDWWILCLLFSWLI